MSLLQIVSDASALCGLGTVTSVVTNTSDLNVQQFLAFAQTEGDELSRFTDWRGLKTEKTFTGTGVASTFALPTDFDRFMAGETMWLDDSPSLPLIGPVTDAQMLALKVAAATPSRPVWRLIGETVEFYPVLASGQLVKTNYYKSKWITSSDGATARTRWAADTDVSLISERVITLGLVWRWKSGKGFDYAEAMRTYEIAKSRLASKDSGQGIIKAREYFARRGNVSDVQVIP